MNVTNVGRLLVDIQTLQYIREFILVRNPMHVKSVGRLLVVAIN
ncbi:unnamed protein product [Gulo gulo]|uniref:Uncharacterized protein n=1 Tax=Gulo gulo TaxID=48420 RepID=A0A9X9LSY4_GULGU|nr:unnamed protein product [Gulo gulo]